MKTTTQHNDVLLLLDMSYVSYYITHGAVQKWKQLYYGTTLETIQLPEPGSVPYDELPDLVNETVHFKEVLTEVAEEKMSVISSILLNTTGHVYSSANTGLNRVDTILARDMHGAEPSFRRVIYPEYKIQRGAERASRNDFNHWRIFDYLTATVYPALLPRGNTITAMHPNAEGDDVIASIIQSDFAKQRYRCIILISSDHDFCQLHKPEYHLRQFTLDGEEVVCQYKYTRKGQRCVEPITADLALMLKILTGDKSDNIPAIKERMGPVTAYKLLTEGDGKANLRALFATDPATKLAFNRNRKLIAFTEIPQDLQSEIVASVQKAMGIGDEIAP